MATVDHDVLIIGAGFSGIFSLYRMRSLGLQARVLETGSGEGGTWFWNKYPGSRCDSESYTYQFTFNQDILDEWNWSEHFASQPEVLEYLQHVTEKLDLRKDMQFNTKVESAHWQDEGRHWLLTDTNGVTYTSRFLITAMGALSDYVRPAIKGIDTFQGEAFHTSRWREDVDFDGKRVGIIGTGATGIQTIQELAKTNLKSLTVFQRSPNWAIPARNEKISPSEMAEIKSQYPHIHHLCNTTKLGFIHSGDPRPTSSVPEPERTAFLEHLWQQKGLAKWVSSFSDHQTDKTANTLLSTFHAHKIRSRIPNPTLAAKLIPTTHGFGTKRVPLETRYFETYTLPHVRLVDYTHDSPIAHITPTSIVLANDEEIELDVLIYATGFDAIVGPLTRGVDIRGRKGVRLAEEWEGEVQTFLGLFVVGFPNMGMVLGPHQAFGNTVVGVEFAVGVLGGLLGGCREGGYEVFEARGEKAREWTDHVVELSKPLLGSSVPNWQTGFNTNVEGRDKLSVLRYNGGGPLYRSKVNEVAARNWEDLMLEK